jgi:hypothetical protein
MNNKRKMKKKMHKTGRQGPEVEFPSERLWQKDNQLALQSSAPLLTKHLWSSISSEEC